MANLGNIWVLRSNVDDVCEVYTGYFKGTFTVR